MRGTDDLLGWARNAISKKWQAAKARVSRTSFDYTALPVGLPADKKRPRTFRLKASLKKATCLCMPKVVEQES